jgi:hypothetical protein
MRVRLLRKVACCVGPLRAQNASRASNGLPYRAIPEREPRTRLLRRRGCRLTKQAADSFDMVEVAVE